MFSFPPPLPTFYFTILRLLCQRFQRDDYLRAFCLSAALSRRLQTTKYIYLDPDFCCCPTSISQRRSPFIFVTHFRTGKLVPPHAWHSLSVGHFICCILVHLPMGGCLFPSGPALSVIFTCTFRCDSFLPKRFLIASFSPHHVANDQQLTA